MKRCADNDEGVLGTLDGARKAFCHVVLSRAFDLMTESGAPVEMAVDRLVTYAALQVVSLAGTSASAANVFRKVADELDAGVFHSITGEGGRAN